ncbi:hypothetical protein [Geomonas sp.]|uniref:hypothetical protein n=1 Tax=Geomonas sp. TaxID=2651584 RepID=UPI002B46FB47|nr:hypothetical protein [Geomonas sp.]HJV33511.1 hypothetical protein [Geomonas sp.]
MSRLLCALLVLVMSLGGCALLENQKKAREQDFYPFPDHYVQFDAAVSWQVQRSGQDLVIDGVFKNIRYDWMNGVEVRVESIDPAGKKQARARSLLFPSRIEYNQMVPFSLKLPMPVPGSKLRFTYLYGALSGAGNGNDGRGGGDTGFWMQSFDAAIPEAVMNGS